MKDSMVIVCRKIEFKDNYTRGVNDPFFYYTLVCEGGGSGQICVSSSSPDLYVLGKKYSLSEVKS